MKLMIIESPGKIAKLSAILGDGWKVSASLGHVCDLPDKEIGVEPPKYKPQYRLSERGASVVSRLRSQCERASEILIGTDPDREGEAIAWHLLGSSQRLAEQYRWNGHWKLLEQWLQQLIDLRLIQRNRFTLRQKRSLFYRSNRAKFAAGQFCNQL